MNPIRQSIIGKGLFIFFLLLILLIGGGAFLIRLQINNLPLIWVMSIAFGILILLLVLYFVSIVRPVRRVSKEIKHLLYGKDFKRIDPITIDEIGMMTHFFNEITRDLEKISYDLKERKRLSSELDIAAKIQQDVLPKEAPPIREFDIVAKTRAAAENGGDTFDFLQSPDGQHFYTYIGDVTGHGVPSGLIMMMVDTLVTTLVSLGLESTRDLIVKTNELLTPRISTRLFMTCVLLAWDKVDHKLKYTGAGHEHILVYRSASQAVEPIRSGGIALGMIPDVSKIAQEHEIELNEGDVILLYTDGITEAKNPFGQMYGLPRLIDSLKHHGYRPSAENIFDNLTKDFSSFVGQYVQIDDITMIVAKYLGQNAQNTSSVKLSVKAEEAEVRQKSSNWDWVS